MQNRIKNLESRILGVDPGYGRVGFAVIEIENGQQKLLHSECFETDKNLSHPERLGLIAERLKEVLEKFQPTKMAVEELLFSKNVKTAIKVAEARGVILAESAKQKIPVFEYNPNSVKLAVTGYGKSDKIQVERMTKKLIVIPSGKRMDDEFDAIAVGLTFFASSRHNDFSTGKHP